MIFHCDMKELKSMAVICDDFPSENRPTNVFVEQLVNAFVDMGVDVKVIATQSLVKELIRHQPILPKYRQMRTKKGNYYDVYRPYSFSFGNFTFFHNLILAYDRWNIAKLLEKIDVSVLYGHFWHNVRKVNLFALRKQIPLFVACGEGDDALEAMMKTISAKELQTLKKSVTGVISVSSENQRKCVGLGLIDNKRIIVQPNCVDTTLFYPQEVAETKKRLGIEDNDFTIAFVGGFIPRKGPDRVAQAVNRLDDEHIKVMFIGKPFSGYEFNFDCKGIVYKGPVNHDDLPKLLNCADIFVLPTLKEGCCNAIVEALACGLPVVSSDGSFNDDILDETNSIRIDPMDVDGIAHAIAYLRDNPDVRCTMRNSSVSRHESFSIEGRALRIKYFIEEKLN